MKTRCYLIAGELSGDTHGAALMESLRAQSDGGMAFAGLGGSRMRALGGEGMTDWIAEAAVVGLWEVVKKCGYFKRRFRETLDQIRHYEPDVIILIDYPGFNLRLARALRKAGHRGKIVYYISPQVWAWNRKRIPMMASLLDLMICIFSFEKALYEDSGLPTVFAGHPLVDELGQGPVLAREDHLLGLFPGSRGREIRKLFPEMLGASARLRRQRPSLRVAAAAPDESLAQTMREMAEAASVQVDVSAGEAHRLMQRATAGVVASGTATLEAAWFGLPYCLVYRVAWPTYFIGKVLVKVDFLGMVNILGGREIVKEFIQADANRESLAMELDRLLQSPGDRSRLQTELAAVAAMLGQPGSHERAARAVVDILASPNA